VKSWLALGLCLSLSIGLASCVGDRQETADVPTPNPPDPEAETESPAPEPAPEPAPPTSEPAPEPEPPVPDAAQSPPDAPAAEPLPRVDADGNYLRTSHRRWVVVDPDPAGLNCRWSADVPDEWYSPAAEFPRKNINEWPVVQQFSTDTELLANLTPAGFATLYDENENPWLKVSLDEFDTICLVRAHQEYVQPVR